MSYREYEINWISYKTVYTNVDMKNLLCISSGKERRVRASFSAAEIQFLKRVSCFEMNWANIVRRFSNRSGHIRKYLIRMRNIQKQPSRSVLRKRCSENIQQIYRRTPMPKYNFNKVAKQLYRNRPLAWLFFCKFAAYFQNTFS